MKFIVMYDFQEPKAQFLILNFSFVLKKWFSAEKSTRKIRIKCPRFCFSIQRLTSFIFFSSINFSHNLRFMVFIAIFRIKSAPFKPLNSWKVCEKFHILSIFDKHKRTFSRFFFHNYSKVEKCFFLFSFFLRKENAIQMIQYFLILA